jgi:hypothetical protein
MGRRRAACGGLGDAGSCSGRLELGRGVVQAGARRLDLGRVAQAAEAAIAARPRSNCSGVNRMYE